MACKKQCGSSVVTKLRRMDACEDWKVVRWCRTQHGCKSWGYHRNRRTFYLVKIRVKSSNIRAKSVEIWVKCIKTSQIFSMCFDFAKMAPKTKVHTFFVWRSCLFLVHFGKIMWNLGKNGAWNALISKNAPNMKFGHSLEVILFVCFGKSHENLGKNPSHLKICLRRRLWDAGIQSQFARWRWWRVDKGNMSTAAQESSAVLCGWMH